MLFIIKWALFRPQFMFISSNFSPNPFFVVVLLADFVVVIVVNGHFLDPNSFFMLIFSPNPFFVVVLLAEFVVAIVVFVVVIVVPAVVVFENFVGTVGIGP